MTALSTWVNRHDSVKLVIIMLGIIPVMLLSLAVSGDLDPFVFVGLLGVVLCGAGAYWLGNWKWILIPVLAMLVWSAAFILAAMRDPNVMETPVSIVLEAPFWTGIPSLIGAGAGYAMKRGNE